MLQVLMSMGGLGSRFAKEGYTTPKPLIEVDGKPMFMRALDSFKPVKNVQYIFVIRKEHDDTHQLTQQIRAQIPNARINILDHDTEGAVESCMVAANDIGDRDPIAIADCDIYFESTDYFKKIAADDKPDGMLLTFASTDPRYSYVETDKAGKVLRTAEKIVISNQALLGGYFFSTGAQFKALASEFLSKPLAHDLKEYFVSHLFNMLLTRGGTVEIAKVDRKYIFGTPEELQAYLKGMQ
jgi:dTDP-glucose pyrophosphorylase